MILTSAKVLGVTHYRASQEVLPVKHLIPRLTIALLTFSVGIGTDLLLASKPKPIEKTSQIPISEPMGFIPVTAPSLPAIPIPETPKIICDYDPTKFDPTASLYVLSQKPKTFGDNDLFLEIFALADDPVARVEIVNLGGNETPPTEFALITDRRFFFVTRQTSDGFEYRFDGEFLRRGVLYEAPEGKAVLKGTLTKSRNGRTVTEWALKFGVVYDGC
jgi:hypothetical protein